MMMMNASDSDNSDNDSDTQYDDMLNIVIASYQSSQQQQQQEAEEQQSSSLSSPSSSLLYKPIQSYRWKYSRDLGDDVMCSTCPLYAIWHYDHHHHHHAQQQQNGDDENSNGNSSNGRSSRDSNSGNVIRVDYNALFTERSCAENAGHASIMADHFFAELAYKMCMSDKYGA